MAAVVWKDMIEPFYPNLQEIRKTDYKGFVYVKNKLRNKLDFILATGQNQLSNNWTLKSTQDYAVTMIVRISVDVDPS